MRAKYLKLVFVSLTAIFLLSACATIPREAPELSMELGKRVSAMESAHITLLHDFFKGKRAEVDRFINEEWVPVFAEEVFNQPKMKSAWDTIVRENNPQERLKFLIIVGPQLQQKINEKRMELVGPLDGLEKQIEQRLRDEYAQTRAINNSITSFLSSASKVEENRNRYLEMLGITDKEIGNTVDQIEEAVEKLVGKGRDVEDAVGNAEKYLLRVREVKDSLKSSK